MYKHNERYLYNGWDIDNDISFPAWIKPTYKIQIESLLKFAEGIGYEMHPDTYQFECYARDTDKPIVDFNTMVRWHNTSFIGTAFFNNFKEELRKASKKLGFSLIMMQEAIDSKLVKFVHLQRKKSKKIRGEKYTTPDIIITSHIIKFA